MSIPYMGNKQKIAPDILNMIRWYSLDATAFYDVFCGSFSVSSEALKRGFHVYSSDINAGVINLLNEVIYGDCIDTQTNKSIFEYPRFIHREEFMKHIGLDDWFSAYLKYVWSFGNKGTSYLFGVDIEEMKFSAHRLVVDKEIDDCIRIIFSSDEINKILIPDNYQDRRLIFRSIVTQKKKRVDLQQLEQLQRLQQLEIKSYYDVDIPEGAVIYCDPPYKSTTEYVDNGFDYDRFYDWLRLKAKTNDVYVSEYSMPDWATIIWQKKKRCTLSQGNKNSKRVEKLYKI